MATFRLTGINNLVTYCAVLGVDPTALCKLGEHSNNEQHPQPLLFGFEAGLYSTVQVGLEHYNLYWPLTLHNPPAAAFQGLELQKNQPRPALPFILKANILIGKIMFPSFLQ